TPLRACARAAAVPSARRIHRDARRVARATARAGPVWERDGDGRSGDGAGARGAWPRPGECEPTARRGGTGRRLGASGDGAGMKLSHVGEAGRARGVERGDEPAADRTEDDEGGVAQNW